MFKIRYNSLILTKRDYIYSESASLKSKKSNALFLFIAFFLFFLHVSLKVAAQTATKQNIVIEWQKPSVEAGRTFLQFRDALYKFSVSSLPSYQLLLPGSMSADPLVTMSDDQYAPLTRDELAADLSAAGPAPVITAAQSVQSGKQFIYINIIPVRKNAVTQVYEKLVSATLNISYQPAKQQMRAAGSFALSSVLSSGDWYKLGVTTDGIYKVTHAFLRNMGADLTGVTLQNIRLYGNGGGMVPHQNSAFRYDDLQENAIEVVDANANGQFDAPDYFLFYGQSPHRWTYNSTNGRYTHQKNFFSDSTFYFLTFSASGNAKRIQNIASLPPSATDRNVSTFVDYVYHENDDKNFLKSGREWYGETFDLNLTQSFRFSMPNPAGPVYIKSNVIARTPIASPVTVFSTFTVSYNGSTLFMHSIPNVGPQSLDTHSIQDTDTAVFNPASGDISIDYRFNPYNSSSIGWLNYIELNAPRHLALTGTELFFRNYSTDATHASYQLTASAAGLKVWNISDHLNVSNQQFTIPQQGTVSFIASPGAGGLSQFVAFTANAHRQPVACGKVENQNLHALSNADYYIVAHPSFLSEAERLAEFHRSHSALETHVVTTPQVYNEFSSGAKDVAAVRDFIRMFYERYQEDPASKKRPRYLLLFGDASYDYKNRIQNNTDYVPTYQGVNSLEPIPSFCTDDFFGFLDPNEGLLGSAEFVDIGVGRFPVKNSSEATAMVDKVITYSTVGENNPASYNSALKNTRLGDWRTVLCFVADDEDGITHIRQSEGLVDSVRKNYPVYNIEKINFDAYQQVSTPGGKRFPEVSELISKRVEKGALLVNYTGHGGEVGWAHEQVLTIPMINSWKNKNNMPAFVTATCEFSRYDDPLRTSAGELVLLNPDGGAICLFTTARVAFSSSNEALNKAFIRHLFTPVDGMMPRLGDLYKRVKEQVSIENFVLLGDPALMLAYPGYKVSTTSITETSTGLPEDTIQALSRITVKGMVTDNAGQKLTSFNGVVYPTIYDKEVMVTTLVNDPTSNPYTFRQRKNIIYRGKASVNNGDFSCSFIVPRDISYQYGTGRLSFYAHNGEQDAMGYDESFVIGGINPDGINDDKGPDIRLYMNSEDFVFGGMTDNKPNVYAILTDSSGINTVGNGIGHDLTAVLDGDQNQLYILNDYYESDLDNYQQGRVYYPLENLAPGRHTVELKAWDINNNSSKTTTEFIVAESADLALAHVLNYPNPFTTHTTFMFEHNKPLVSMWVQVQVFTVTGKLIKTLDKYVINEGFRNSSIEWDGRDDFGDRIGRGVYVYRVKVKTADGEVADKFERLVVLR